MRTKLRIVKLQNDQYEIQAKWRTWYDFFWQTVPGCAGITTEGQARTYLVMLIAQWRTTVTTVIEERTL